MSGVRRPFSLGKREEQPYIDGNVLAKRIVCIAVREKATNSSKGIIKKNNSQLVINFIAVCCAICGDRVESGLCLPSLP